MSTVSPLFPFTHEHVLQTALPLGGIGAGCVCFNGYGALQDFALYNRPATSALPDGWQPQEAAFALLRTGGAKPVARLVEGPLPVGKIYDQGLQGQGFRRGGYEGLPRFRQSRFDSGYPFGRVHLSDPEVPLNVEILAWNPFIPLDDVQSGLPCAILEYTLKNPTRREIPFQFSYHLSHLAPGSAEDSSDTRNRVVPGKGIVFHNTEDPNSEKFGSASLTLIGHRPVIKGMWLRSGWFDAISALWRECEAGRFTANDGAHADGLTERRANPTLPGPGRVSRRGKPFTPRAGRMPPRWRCMCIASIGVCANAPSPSNAPCSVRLFRPRCWTPFRRTWRS